MKEHDLLLQKTGDQLLEQLVAAHGKERALSILACMSGYREMPPTIDQFLTDKHFLGESTGTLFETWRKALQEIFPTPFYSPYLEIIGTGGIGQGKTTFAILGMLYDLCKVLYLENPQEYFHVMPATIIAFAMMNVTKTLAKDVNLLKLQAYILDSPFFRTQINARKTVWHPTTFPRRIDLVAGSRFDQTTGRDVISVLFDEINLQTKVKDQALTNYHSLRTRLESRFLGKGGTYPAHLWLMSSRTDETGWLEVHIREVQEIMERTGKAHTRVFDYPTWELLKEKGIYSGETFKVFIGDQKRDPFLVRSPDELHGLSDEHVLDVPVEYKERFELNLHLSLQELAGKGTFSSNKFIPSGELLQECQIRENPVTRDEIQMDFFDERDTLLSYVQYEKIKSSLHPRFIHIDLGLNTDRAGITSCRFDGFVNVKEYDPLTLSPILYVEPIYYVDFILAIRARPGQEIPIGKIYSFLTSLRKIGYPIHSISFDGLLFSANIRQDLTLAGFNAEYLSMDRTKDPYTYLKRTITESRLNSVKHPILDHELHELLNTPKKIDHPPNGSKDLADSLAGSVYLAHQHADENYVPDPQQYLQALTDHFNKDGISDPLLRELHSSWKNRTATQYLL